MNPTPENSSVPIRIQRPCPKSWDELEGGAGRRYCSECCLHVHDATRLTQAQARDLVAGATSRVCMRIEYDSHGAPIFSDSLRAIPARPRSALAARDRTAAVDFDRAAAPGCDRAAAAGCDRAAGKPAARIARWVLSAASGLLAACNGSVAPSPPEDPAPDPNEIPTQATMGVVRAPELGDVALPQPPMLQTMGEAMVVPEPIRPPPIGGN